MPININRLNCRNFLNGSTGILFCPNFTSDTNENQCSVIYIKYSITTGIILFKYSFKLYSPIVFRYSLMETSDEFKIFAPCDVFFFSPVQSNMR